MSGKVRVLRVLEYVGNREWMEETLSRGGVPANGQVVLRGTDSGCIIKSSLIGDFPESLSEEEIRYHDHRVENSDEREFTVVQNENKDLYELFNDKGELLLTGLREIQGFFKCINFIGVEFKTNYK